MKSSENMIKEQLATALRQRIYELAIQDNIPNAKERLNAISDEEILILSVTCVVCNAMRDDYRWLQSAILIANDVEDFWSLTSPIYEHERVRLSPPKDNDPFSFLFIERT
jgi:hypothetical protein